MTAALPARRVADRRAGGSPVGLAPRATRLVWIVIAYAGLIGVYADLLGLPGWTVKLSPFSHLQLLPAEDVRWAPLLILTAIAAVLIAVGLAAFRRRDLTTTA